MANEDDFPVKLTSDADCGAGALRWTGGVLALTTLALALLNAGAIANWSQELAPGPHTAKIMAAAETWKNATVRLGLDRPHASLHGEWKRAQSTRWPGEPVSELAEASPPRPPQ